ncbi:MAG: Ig-like domain-containing protein, partial [Methanophagales archaeon]|nr:Ig-like domain-containing protein [Methanophagales archaeon]
KDAEFTIAWKSPFIHETSHYEPVTEVEYPGSSTNVTLPTIPSNQSLMPPPYHPSDRFPEPGAKDVPLDTYISVSFTRPPGILKLGIEPEAEISHIKKELILYSGKYTFYLAKPLQPGTNYTVTITAGQREPPGPGFAPTLTTSWQFTTTTRTWIFWRGGT